MKIRFTRDFELTPIKKPSPHGLVETGAMTGSERKRSIRGENAWDVEFKIYIFRHCERATAGEAIPNKLETASSQRALLAMTKRRQYDSYSRDRFTMGR